MISPKKCLKIFLYIYLLYVYNVRRFHRQFESIETTTKMCAVCIPQKLNVKNLELMKLNSFISQPSTRNILQNINHMSTATMSNA